MSSTFTKVCVTVALMPAVAIAQDQTETETPPEPNDDAFLGTIVLSAPDNPIAEDGISVTSEGLALSNPADLSELFVAEPTIAVGGSIPMSQKVYVNGIEENNLAISIDGARQNNKVFHHNTTTLIDPALLKAVRIEPGVASADAGPGALAGALAYETKDVDDLLDHGDTFGGRYKLEYDSNGDVFSNSLSLYGRDGGFEYLLFGKSATGNNREDGDGNDILASGTDLNSLLGKIAYETEGGHRFEFSAENVADDDVRPYRANIGEVIGGSLPLTRPYDLQRENYSITYTRTNPTDMWNPTIRLSYSGTELLNDETNEPERQRVFGETTSLNGEISNRFTLSWGEINAGIDFYKDEANIDFVDFTDPNEDYNVGEELQNIGVFAQVRMEPNANTRLSFGARADFQDFEARDGYKQSESGLSGNVSGEWDVTDRVTVGAGYSHVWGGLELAETYIMTPIWNYPADGLGTVTADNAYIAASYTTGTWAIDGKVFGTDINNARAASIRSSSGANIRADVESRGFELGFSTTWDGGFFRVGYANIDTEVNGRVADSFTGNYLTIPLGEFFTLQTAHRFDNGILVGGDAQIALDYSDTFDFLGGSPTIDGYTVVNTFVEYSPKRMENLTLRMEVNNLFDEQYTARATYGQDFPTEVVSLPEPGRSIRLSAEILF
ncbi:TonB-dependent receptor [Tateyamaria omphalii]|uniref:TonB-dependent receptor domain-containing protein n=1 Tax=Tateyamaria omphalii TaxID=299262 RepID=UPI001C9991C0|nr:TonB-dependent receptor [Tateyamaria omphalii]MBY5934959.1 TonB-dependent receptor [Tateyamaria omphalii]